MTFADAFILHINVIDVIVVSILHHKDYFAVREVLFHTCHLSLSLHTISFHSAFQTSSFAFGLSAIEPALINLHSSYHMTMIYLGHSAYSSLSALFFSAFQ